MEVYFNSYEEEVAQEKRNEEVLREYERNLKKKQEEQEKKTAKFLEDLAKKGITPKEYWANEEKKKTKAKVNRYKKEIIDLEKRLNYLKNFIKKNEETT